MGVKEGGRWWSACVCVCVCLQCWDCIGIM